MEKNIVCINGINCSNLIENNIFNSITILMKQICISCFNKNICFINMVIELIIFSYHFFSFLCTLINFKMFYKIFYVALNDIYNKDTKRF